MMVCEVGSLIAMAHGSYAVASLKGWINRPFFGENLLSLGATDHCRFCFLCYISIHELPLWGILRSTKLILCNPIPFSRTSANYSTEQCLPTHNHFLNGRFLYSSSESRTWAMKAQT